MLHVGPVRFCCPQKDSYGDRVLSRAQVGSTAARRPRSRLELDEAKFDDGASKADALPPRRVRRSGLGLSPRGSATARAPGGYPARRLFLFRRVTSSRRTEKIAGRLTNVPDPARPSDAPPDHDAPRRQCWTRCCGSTCQHDLSGYKQICRKYRGEGRQCCANKMLRRPCCPVTQIPKKLRNGIITFRKAFCICNALGPTKARGMATRRPTAVPPRPSSRAVAVGCSCAPRVRAFGSPFAPAVPRRKSPRLAIPLWRPLWRGARIFPRGRRRAWTSYQVLLCAVRAVVVLQKVGCSDLVRVTRFASGSFTEDFAPMDEAGPAVSAVESPLQEALEARVWQPA